MNQIFTINKLLVAMILVFITTLSNAVIYKCKLENGTLSYQKRPCVEDDSTILENIQKAKKKKQQKQNKLSDKQLDLFFKENVVDFSVPLKSYIVSVVKLKQWRAFKKILGENVTHIKFLDDTSGSEISLLMDFMLIAPDKSFDSKSLEEEMLRLGKSFLASSTQSKVTPVNVNVNDGIGYISLFTDKNLVNKSTYPAGEYLHTIKGLVFKEGFLIHVTLLSNDLESLNQIMALQSFISGVQISKLNTTKNSSAVDSVSENPLDKPFKNLYNGNKKESVAMFEDVIKDEPENFGAWMGYCIALRDTNRLQSAFIACDKAFSLDPKNIEAHVSLLNLYAKARVWTQGLQFIKGSIPDSSNETLLNSITNFGYYAMLENDLNTAHSAFMEAKKRGSKSIKLDVDLAIVKHLNGDSDDAMMLLLEVINKKPKDKFANAILDAILEKQPLIAEFVNTNPYASVPKRLTVLGKGKNLNQEPDQWVKKTFPLRGVGYINIDVPESWYEWTQITQTDESNDEITIKLLDLKTLTIITIDIGKVGKDWGIVQIKKQLTSSLSVFFDQDDIHLTPIGSSKVGYAFAETQSKDEGYIKLISAQQELIKNTSVKSLVVKGKNKESVYDTQRIINSIKIINQDDTPLLNSRTRVSKKSDMPANDTDLPKPPEGFSWVRMPKIMAAFLKPNGWFEHNKSSKGSYTYAISKESIKENGSFETGLTVIAITDVQEKLNLPPYTIALQMFDDISHNNSNTIIKSKDISQGKFKSFIVLYENHPRIAEPIVVHKIFIANDKTGSLYIVSFEAPKADWGEAWKIGNQILKYYLVDDEF